MGQSDVCETVCPMTRTTAQITMPTPQNGTVPPRQVPHAEGRPRECLILKEVERLIAAAQQNQYRVSIGGQRSIQVNTTAIIQPTAAQ
jgi:hypothetical protein